MKCSRSLLSYLFLILSFSFKAMSSSDIVMPIDGELTIENGEIYIVKIFSNKSAAELKTFKHKKINDIMYVLDFELKSGMKTFQVFVTNPPPPSKKTEVKELPLFQVKDIKYDYKQKNTQEPIKTVKVDFKEVKPVDTRVVYAACFVFIIILIGGLFYIRKTARKRKLKRLKYKKATELINLYQHAQNRLDFETIYSERRYFLDLFHDQEDLREFFTFINKVQYKREWTEDELKKLRRMKDKITNLRRRSGV